MREYDHTLASDQRYRAAQRTNQRTGSGTEGLDDFHRPINSWWLVLVGFGVLIIGLIVIGSAHQ